MTIHDKTLSEARPPRQPHPPTANEPQFIRMKTRCGMRAWLPPGVDLERLYGPLPVDPTVQPARLP